ncbi:MAG: hypothetical protein ABS78_21925 [Phenylobacterium sp. SCN 70-31]|nr:MAG: hypothetical protein ABS78_21925 [Phenylobacterium sp. SCN 70-31]
MRTDAGREPHAAAFRGALWITLIATTTTALALTFQHVQTATLLDLEMGHLIEGEADALAMRFQDGGTADLSDRIDKQLAANTRDVVYMVADRNGRRLAGNVMVWPAPVREDRVTNLSVMVRSGQGVQPTEVEGEARTLDADTRLFIGHLADSRLALGRKYWTSLIGSVAITGVLSLLLGWIVSRRGLSFVKQAAVTGNRFLAGRLDERLRLSGRNDEFDRLAEVINTCFEEIERMIGSLRAATDGMAHDLKTPLTRMKARLELAMLRGRSADGDLLAENANDVDTLLELINGLLTLARADAATSDSFQHVDLAAVVQDAVDLYAPVAEERGCKVVPVLAAAPMNGSRPLLLHLAANLIDNAIKHSPPGGSIIVATIRDGASIRLSVADGGPGIPAGATALALRRFGRLDESRGSPGSGLGLTLVQTVARVHRGHLSLSDNAPGLLAEVVFETEPNPGGRLGAGRPR